MSRLIALDAIDLVLRVASKGTGGTEVPANSNKGPFVEPILQSVGLAPGNPWCAADVYDTGRKALEAQWPLPKTGSCYALGEFAKAHGILMDQPERGDVFLVWELVDGQWRFAHTGFVRSVLGPLLCATQEGNTSGAGSREGWMDAQRTRQFQPADKFVRWVTLLGGAP
jgi:hypothetical protein